jgi:hypothetical protein
VSERRTVDNQKMLDAKRAADPHQSGAHFVSLLIYGQTVFQKLIYTIHAMTINKTRYNAANHETAFGLFRLRTVREFGNHHLP